MPDTMNGDTQIAVARLDERIKALSQAIQHNESAAERAMNISATELSRRLDLLNHHQSEMRDQQDRFQTKEAAEACGRETNSRLTAIEKAVWVAMGGSAVVGGLSAVLVKYLFRV